MHQATALPVTAACLLLLERDGFYVTTAWQCALLSASEILCICFTGQRAHPGRPDGARL